MNEAEKQFADAIIETLQAVLSADKALIDKGQQQLTVFECRTEYTYMLVKILLDQNFNFAIRQLAGVLFKQYVEVHWSQHSEKFKPPEIELAFKDKIKEILPHGLADPLSKIRITVAHAIATIAHWDWPELWPNLFNLLISALSGGDINAIHGSLKTLTEFIEEVTDIQMPQVAPAIMPQIYNIFVNPQHFQIRLRSRAMEIFNSLANVVAEMAEYDKTAAKKYLNPYLENFLNAMIKSLSLPDDNVTMDCGLKKDIIKVITTLVKAFPKKLANYMNDILSQVWNCLVQSSNIYVSQIVNCSKENRNEQIDTEGEELSYENLVYQLFEFILALKEKSRFKPIIKKAIEELSYYSILYMQITDDQMEQWISNPEQYAEEEDEETFSYSVRISGVELLDSIINDYKKESASAICRSITRHIQSAQALKLANNAHWWKLYEASLLAIASVKDELQEIHDNGGSAEFDLNAFINQVVIPSLYESNFPFLVGRAILAASRFSKLLPPEALNTLIEATASALQSNQNPIIRISAIRAIYCFCEELNDETKSRILVQHLPQVVNGLIQLITENMSTQIGSLALETLESVLGIDEQFVASVENKVAPLAIALFVKHGQDPLLNSILSEIFKILISNKQIYAKLEQRLLPTLSSILNNQKDCSPLFTPSLELLTTFVRNSPNIPLSDYLMNLFVVTVNLCLKNDDTALLQSGGECLRAYISRSSEQIISWKNESGNSALNFIVMVISHMLDPKTSENSCSFIGKFINTVIRHTGHALGDNLDLILKAVLSKMQSSKVLIVQQSLIIVFAHLINAQLDNVLSFLSNIPGPSGQPVLEFLMTEWVSKQNSFVGPYECKISILALSKLLEHAVSQDDKRFQNIFVRGDRIINPVEGIKTRSKAKNEKELYTQVPLLVKIYKLLINELHNQIEEKKDNDEEDYEDEDYEEDETEDDGTTGAGGDDGIEDDEDTEVVDDDSNVLDAANVGLSINKYDMYDDIFDKEQIFDEDDPDALEDPLMKIDLLEYLTQYLRTLSQHPCYSIFTQHHNEIEKEVLKEIGISV